MKRLIPSLILMMIVLSWSVITFSQSNPVPTLIPPTLVPTPSLGVNDSLASESVIARIVREGKVRVGVLFNEPPFGERTLRGELRGFDADLARQMAETWGVEVEFVQVTRQNGIELVRTGQIDLLIAAQVHNRALDAVVEFSQPYRMSQQAMMLRNDDPAETLFNMSGRRVGYVLGTEGERAILNWQTATSVPLTLTPYLTLDRAISALFANEIDGVVGRTEQLLRVGGDAVFNAKILDEPVVIEPFAIAFQRQDVNLRNLVNQTLQFLLNDGSMQALYDQYFQAQAVPEDMLPRYEALSENAPVPSQFPTDVRYPAQYVMPRLLETRILRVAGFNPVLPDTATESERRVHEFNRQLLEQLTLRWDIQIEYITGGDVFELLELGQADMAMGVTPNWSVTNRVDFSQPYMLHGDRLMVETGSNIGSFNELRGRWVGIMNSEPEAEQRAIGWGESINARVRIYTTTEQDAASAMLIENNADVIYGDSLKLIPHLVANPNTLTLTERWYSRNYVAFAVPRNDLDFRLLVDYTLQTMQTDGTLTNLLALVIPPNSELPQFTVIPGSNEYYGIRLNN
jgi:ABC-type amino acid transport substrate-binding protein